MKVRQHLPAYFDPINIERAEAEFETVDDLKLIPWVKSWVDRPDFHCLSQCPVRHQDKDGTYKFQVLLMAERNGGSIWNVIGMAYVDDDTPNWPFDPLPIWEPPLAST